MKKRIIPFLLLVLIPSISYADLQIKTETPLLPEVKKILEVPSINKKEMDQNAYVYLISFDATDDNYLDLAKNYLVESNQWLIQNLRNLNATKEQPRPKLKYDKLVITNNINGKRYMSPCRDISNFHCIEDTLKLEKQIAELLNDNKKIMERYEYIISLPDYYSYNELEDGFFANYELYSFLSDLKLFQSIDLINQGNILEGLKILQKELDFAQKMYASKSHFISKAVARNRLLTIYNTTSGLIDNQPELMDKPNYKKLVSLLSTLPTQDKINLDTMLLYERNDIVFGDVFNLLRVAEDTSSKDYARLKQLAVLENIPLTFDFNKTINKDYQAFTSYIYIANLKLPELATEYQKIKRNKNNSPEQCSLSIPDFKETVFKRMDKSNMIGDYLLCGNDPSKYMARFVYYLFDVQNYLALINLKLAIKQNSIELAQIPQFLSDVNNKSINPITKKPFLWNKENATISTEQLKINSSDLLKKESVFSVMLNIE